MGDPSVLRDSTQIVLPWAALERVHADLEAEFTVTVYDEGPAARIIGSPAVIGDVTEYLVREGVAVR